MMRARRQTPRAPRSPVVEALEGRALLSVAARVVRPIVHAEVARPEHSFRLDDFGSFDPASRAIHFNGRTHLLGTYYASGTITRTVPDPNHPVFSRREGTLLIATADGATLSLAFANAQANPANGITRGVLVITGGTGRLAGRTGRIPFVILQGTLTGKSIEFIANGRINL